MKKSFLLFILQLFLPHAMAASEKAGGAIRAASLAEGISSFYISEYWRLINEGFLSLSGQKLISIPEKAADLAISSQLLWKDPLDFSKGLKGMPFEAEDRAALIKIIGRFYISTTAEINISKAEEGAAAKTEKIKALFLHNDFPSVLSREDEAKAAIAAIEEQEFSALVVNFSEANISWSLVAQKQFMRIGRLLKKREANVYIEGPCESLCLKYILPAAKAVYMGESGYIALTAPSARFIHSRIQLVEESVRRFMHDMAEKEIFPAPLGKSLAAALFQLAKAAEDQAGFEADMRQIIEQVSALREKGASAAKMGLAQAADFAAFLDFAESLSGQTQELVKQAYLEIYMKSHPFLTGLQTALVSHKSHAALEEAYYQEISWPQEGAFRDFLEVSSQLILNERALRRILGFYRLKFEVWPQGQIKALINDLPPGCPIKPGAKYMYAAPDGALLRGAGLDLKGENQRGALSRSLAADDWIVSGGQRQERAPDTPQRAVISLSASDLSACRH